MGTSIPRIELPEHRLAEDYREYLSDPTIPEEQGRELQQKVDVLPAEKQRSFLDKVAPILEERLKILEQKQIDINLLSRAREVQAYVDKLLKNLETRVNSIAPPPPATRDTFVDKLQKEWEKHPVRTTCTGAALVLGVLTVTSWLTNRFKEATNAGREAMKTTGSWIKRALIATGVALGVFLGLKVYKEYKVVKPFLDDFKGRPQGQGQGLLSLFGFGKPPEEPEPEPPKPEPPKPQPTPGPEILEGAGEDTNRELERLRIRGLPLLFSDLAEEIEFGNAEVDKDDLLELLQRDTVRNLPIHDLIAFAERDGHSPPAEVGGLTEGQRKALHFLARICKHYKGRGKSVEGVTLIDVVNHYTHVARLFQKINEATKGKGLLPVNPKAIMESIFSGEGAVHEVCSKEELVERYPALKGKEARFIRFCVYERDRNLSSLITELEGQTIDSRPHYDPSFLPILRSILQDVERAKDYLRLYTHGHKRPFGDSSADVLDAYLRENLSLSDALQLSLYLRKIGVKEGAMPTSLEHADPLWAFLLQMKVFDMVARRGKDEKQGIAFRDFLFKQGLLEALGLAERLHLPEETKELIWKVGLEAAEMGVEGALKFVDGVFKEVAISIEELTGLIPEDVSKPTLEVGTGVLTAAGLVQRSRNLLVYRFLHRVRDIIDYNPDQLGRLWGLNPEVATSVLTDVKTQANGFCVFYEEPRGMSARASIWTRHKRAKEALKKIRDIVHGAGGQIRPLSRLSRIASGAGEALGATAETAQQAAQRTREMFRQLRNARSVEQMRQMIRSLADSPLKTRLMEGLEKASKWVEQSKFVRYAGPVVDAVYLILVTHALSSGRQEIEDAPNDRVRAILEQSQRALYLEAVTVASVLSPWLLRSIGVTFTGAARFLGPLALAAPIIGAGLYRHAVYNEISKWEYGASDWAKFDPIVILTEMKESESNFESKGRNAAYGEPRVVGWWKRVFMRKTFKRQQEERFTNMQRNNSMLREEMLRGYLKQNAFLPQHPDEEKHDYDNRRNQYIADAVIYLDAITYDTDIQRGALALIGPMKLERAEAYAELCMRKREWESQGEKPVITYTSPDGREQTIDLTNFDMNLHRRETGEALARYIEERKPLERLAQWELLVMLVKEQGDVSKIPDLVRMEVLSDLRHQIYQAEKHIRETDFSGWGDETEKNVVRVLLRQQMEERTRELSSNVLTGTITVEGYEKILSDLGIILYQAKDAAWVYKSATQGIKEKPYDERDRLALLGLVPLMA
jgi:hypothetical protein